MYEIIKSLCKENGTSVTALCREITGSSGNLATWKKGNIRKEYLIKIAERFDIPVGYLTTEISDGKFNKIGRTVAEVIKELLNLNQISAKKMLFDLGFSHNLITQWQNGNVPSLDKIVNIAEYFDVSLEYLTGKEYFKEIEYFISDGNIKPKKHIADPNKYFYSLAIELKISPENPSERLFAVKMANEYLREKHSKSNEYSSVLVSFRDKKNIGIYDICLL